MMSLRHRAMIGKRKKFLDDIVFWLKANEPSTIELDSESRVNRIYDYLGSGKSYIKAGSLGPQFSSDGLIFNYALNRNLIANEPESSFRFYSGTAKTIIFRGSLTAPDQNNKGIIGSDSKSILDQYTLTRVRFFENTSLLYTLMDLNPNFFIAMSIGDVGNNVDRPAKIYVNNTFINVLVDTTTDFNFNRIGKGPLGDFHGEMKDFIHYNRQLSEAEILRWKTNLG